MRAPVRHVVYETIDTEADCAKTDGEAKVALDAVVVAALVRADLVELRTRRIRRLVARV